MTNDSRSAFNLYQSRDSNTTNGCNLLPSNNGTVALAANWENIPETLLLNASIGFLLFMLFYLLTKIAWIQPSSSDQNENNNLVSFLYGYRDPERWYVIPRFEFLRRSMKHHEHDLLCTKLYVPPKLPLANPIELLAYQSDVGDDIESADETREEDEENILAKVIKSITSPRQTIKIDTGERQPNSDQSEAGRNALLATKDPQADKQTAIDNVGLKLKSTIFKSALNSPAPLSGSFFYPSILTAERLQASNLARHLNRFFAVFFRVTDADIIYAKGIDAYEYLLFQRHLIFIMLVANVFCLGIILPVHWYFGQNIDSGNAIFISSFQRTTIKNMASGSSYYWVHIVSSVLIVIFAIMILNSYRDSIVTKNETQLARKTLLIGNIPANQRTRAKLCELFREYFTRTTIKSIQFVYDTSRLEYYQSQLDTIMAAKEYCVWYRKKYNKDLMVKQTDVNEGQYCNGNCRLCSFLLLCFCYWPRERKQPGSAFYGQEERRYRDKIKLECEKLIKEPSEYAFVTLRSNRQAKRVMQELTKLKSALIKDRYAGNWDTSKTKSQGLKRTRPNTKQQVADERTTGNRVKLGKDVLISNDNSASDPLDPNNNPHVRSIRSPIAVAAAGHRYSSAEARRSTVETLDGPVTWSVRYAPHPDNVEYYDILEMSNIRRYTSVFLHILMIIIFIFFTTPNVLLSAIERWSVLQPEATKQMTGFQGIVINYLSILLQIIATAILPSLIVLISKQIPYEDTSSKNHSTMWKTYLFLVLMVIVMPSIGMNSAQALLSSKISPECWFPTDNGAYFVNYVLTSIFLSSVLELIKPMDMIFYYFILLTGRSMAEFEGGRQYIEREFSVSMQHTSVLLVFSVVMTYMISCPLIAPAGLLYLIVKHAIDHYHLFYTYFTKKVDKNLQRTIEIFVRVALLLMLFQTTVAIYISTGASYFSLISQVVFWLTMAIILFSFCFDCNSKQISASIGQHRQLRRDFCACFYLPRVIGDLLRADAVPESCISRKV